MTRSERKPSRTIPLQRFEKERIVPTERDTFFRMTQIHGRVHDEGAAMMGGVSGNAGLFSTIEDLSKLARLYLNRGVWNGDTIIAPEIIDEFTRCQFVTKTIGVVSDLISPRGRSIRQRRA